MAEDLVLFQIHCAWLSSLCDGANLSILVTGKQFSSFYYGYSFISGLLRSSFRRLCLIVVVVVVVVVVRVPHLLVLVHEVVAGKLCAADLAWKELKSRGGSLF